MFCAGKVLQLYLVVFCVLGAVLIFYFRLVTNETPNKLGQVQRRQCSDEYPLFLMNHMSTPLHPPKVCGSVAFCFYRHSKHNILNIVHTSATYFGHHQVDVTKKWTESMLRRPPLHCTLRSCHSNIYLVTAETCCSRCMHNVQYVVFVPIKETDID